MTKIKHTHIFLAAFRTAILFFTGFLTYEILLELEKTWNLKNNNKELEDLYKRRFIKFFIILFLDLILLYTLFLFTREYF